MVTGSLKFCFLNYQSQFKCLPIRLFQLTHSSLKNYLNLSCVMFLRLRLLMYKQQTTPYTAHDCSENQI